MGSSDDKEVAPDGPTQVLKIDMNLGEEKKFSGQFVMEFYIETAYGSYIKGTIPVNTQFVVCNNGDLNTMEITIPENAIQDPTIVK